MKEKVLFICVHNSARSQMAEGLLNAMCLEHFAAESAGLEPGELNPYAVEAMREIGIDISGKDTKAVFDLFKSGRLYRHVIAVCDTATAERCPVFPGLVERHQWSFPDPAAVGGSDEERLAAMREVREMIRAQVEKWCAERCAGE
jgi:arsenate reductase